MLATLAQAYIAQSYSDALTPDTISIETHKTLIQLLGDGSEDMSRGVSEILTSPHYHLHIGAVRAMAYSIATGVRKIMALTRGFLRGRRPQCPAGMAERAVFSDPRSNLRFEARDGFPVNHRRLTEQNFYDALRASGTIPVYMRRFISLKTRSQLSGWRTAGLPPRAGQFLADIRRHCFVPAFL